MDEGNNFPWLIFRFLIINMVPTRVVMYYFIFDATRSINIKTNISKRFLSFLDKYIPGTHRYRNIFHRSSVKLSHNCYPNEKSIITCSEY